FIRIYLKPQGEKADMDEPLVLKKEATVEDLCKNLHKDFLNKFKYARIWGESADHPNQKVGKSHELVDEDIVSIITN
ncbi:MAG: TGS domain-containing protein, partial [Hadesarchaea archaeon]|nr:TGS domain-containing protein [Hadesarchaea archaeon]